MTEKLLTGTLSLNTNKQKIENHYMFNSNGDNLKVLKHWSSFASLDSILFSALYLKTVNLSMLKEAVFETTLLRLHMRNIRLAGRGSSIGSMSAWHASGPKFDPHVRHSLSWRQFSTAILPLPLIQELLAKKCALNTGKLAR